MFKISLSAGRKAELQLAAIYPNSWQPYIFWDCINISSPPDSCWCPFVAVSNREPIKG